MYSCICTAISDADVARYVQAGARTVGDIYRMHGKKAECGSCAFLLRGELLKQLALAAEPQQQAA